MQDSIWTILTTLGLYAIVIISPGPNFALVSRLAISGALPSALGATLGLSLAATFYAVLSMTGLAVLIVRVDWFATAIHIVGGLYLVYLGLSGWLVSSSGENTPPPPTCTSWSGFRLGTLVELTNPKGITFFLGLYAVTIPVDADMSVKLIVLLGGFMLEMVWYGSVAMLMSSPPAQAAYTKSGAWIDRIAGMLLIGFGIKMLTDRL
ncbi:LysE family translocator [Sinorhizobium meliloti]|uniref:LysE family translocator n=1 Tax=Rhizobium meliloti TaxID=382 RepID=UPI002090CEE0|nr:LysE family transporter [Sinorhizobium meliloti]MCO5966574.1 LysE family translocator [Sinorhizobium meliloti]